MTALIGLMMLTLVFQGPKNLQVDADDKILPPVIVPAGTAIPLKLTNRITTKTAKDGDGVYAITVFPITVDNKIVVPVGSYVRGRISEVQRPGRVTGKAELTLSFQTLILPSGITIPIYTSLGSVGEGNGSTGENTVQGDSSKGKDAGTIATGAGTGAGIGGIGSRSAKGAGIGGVGGAAVGVASVLLTRGSDLVLEPGTSLEIILDRPIEP